MNTHYDYFVIGAGSGGMRSARIASSLGAKVGLAESTHLGGTCVNLGCVPKKLMAYAADFHADFEDSKGFGWNYKNATFDWDTFIKNKNKEISRINGIYDTLVEKNNLALFRNHAQFLDNKTLQVGEEAISADHILIASGAKPFLPDIPGIEHAITSDEAFFLENLPDHIVIVGGGYIAVEFAHIFSGMGAKVTLLYRKDLFLRQLDTDIRETLAEEMREQGITIHFNCDPEEIEPKGKTLSVQTNSTAPIECDQILMATGRIPNIDSLGLDKAKIKTHENGSIIVDKHYQTSQPGIYALGDVANKYHLTPVATAEGTALAHHLFGETQKPVNYANIPTAIFSRPPITTVGLSENQAQEEGYDISIYTNKFRPMKNTLSGRNEFTLMKLIVDKKTDKVLGAHMIGEDSPEIIQGFAVALNAGATKADFDNTIGIHPSSAEEFVTMR